MTENSERTLLHETVHPEGWPQPRGYANAVKTDGGIIYTGGLVGWDQEGRFPKGFVAQAHQTFRNIRDVLEAAGGSPLRLFRTSVTPMVSPLRSISGTHRMLWV